MKIEIMSCPGADSRTSTTKPSLQELNMNTLSHISDVQRAMSMYAQMLMDAGWTHDWTKRSYLEEFHNDFTSLEPGDDFKNGSWYPMHVSRERHHLLEKAPNDVNLIDVLEYISDCVMAGLARSGSVSELSLPDELMRKAFSNTVDILTANVTIISKEEMDRRQEETKETAYE